MVIAGLKGGSGKTTCALGIIKAWRDKGLNLIPFKKGPDYIDAGWLASAAGFPCYNLDPFLIGRQQVLSSFSLHISGADGAVIEGNRGLYDGMDVNGTYSTSELAKLLKAPVVLIIDCSKVTRTVAAMVLGCQRFDPDVNINGVILNQIAGSRHESIIRSSIEQYCNIPVLGAIPRLKEEYFPERHMGLTPFQEHPEVEMALAANADIARKYLDLDWIWRIAKEAAPLEVCSGLEDLPSTKEGKKGKEGIGRLISLSSVTPQSSPRIGVIKDSAFQFYYPENIEELERRGARIVEISALTEKVFPDIDALYIGGGFPETHAIALAENMGFRNSLKKAVEGGLPVYAECGGLMYLGEGIVLEDKTYPMTGVFPIVFGLDRRPQAHGYSIIEVEHSNPYYPVGITLRGHEFHYSRALRIGEKAGIYMAFIVRRGQGIKDRMDGICYKNTLATYTHLHALGASEWADGLIERAVSYMASFKNRETGI